jgi:hypothetical protein
MNSDRQQYDQCDEAAERQNLERRHDTGEFTHRDHHQGEHRERHGHPQDGANDRR